jgi:hypothetical protein
MNREDLKIGDVIILVWGEHAIVKEICEDLRGYDDYVVKDNNGHIIRPNDITGVIAPNAVGGYNSPH